MIDVSCSFCKNPLEEPGGILLSPPIQQVMLMSVIEKHHVCVRCYKEKLEPLLDQTKVGFVKTKRFPKNVPVFQFDGLVICEVEGVPVTMSNGQICSMVQEPGRPVIATIRENGAPVMVTYLVLEEKSGFYFVQNKF